MKSETEAEKLGSGCYLILFIKKQFTQRKRRVTTQVIVLLLLLQGDEMTAYKEDHCASKIASSIIRDRYSRVLSRRILR